MAIYGYRIGINSAGLVYLESIIFSMCQGKFVRWPVLYTGGDGHDHGDGLPTTQWHFEWISQADLNVLRTYVTDSNVYLPSKAVAISTRLDDGTFGDFDCIMHWPKNLEAKRVMGDRYSDVDFEFTRMELVT